MQVFDVFINNFIYIYIYIDKELTVDDMANLNTSEDLTAKGYYCPKHGIAPTIHKLKFRKGSKSIDMTKFWAAKTPAPGTYHNADKWIARTGKFLKGKKKSVIDESVHVTKYVPGPGSYTSTPKKKVQFGFS